MLNIASSDIKKVTNLRRYEIQYKLKINLICFAFNQNIVGMSHNKYHELKLVISKKINKNSIISYFLINFLKQISFCNKYLISKPTYPIANIPKNIQFAMFAIISPPIVYSK